jgi:hypothetical protein
MRDPIIKGEVKQKHFRLGMFPGSARSSFCLNRRQGVRKWKGTDNRGETENII